MAAPSLPAKTATMVNKQRTASHQASLWQRMRENVWSYVYILPMAVLLLVFTIYPIFASIGYMFYQWNGFSDATAFVGLDNFKDLIADPLFWKSVSNSFIYMIVLVPIQLTMALMMALVLNNPKMRFSTVYRAIYFVPVVTSSAIIGVVMKLMITGIGDPINQWLQSIHVITAAEHIDWLGDPRFALGIIITIGIWNSFGYNLIYFLAGLQTIPAELYEAARIDGANGVQRFWFVTIPLLRSVGLIILFMAILGSLNVFDIVQVMTQGGPYYATSTVSLYITQKAFGGMVGAQSSQPNVGFSSAASFFWGMMIMGLTIVQLLTVRRINKQREEQRLAAD